jgi:hypothetical protein
MQYLKLLLVIDLCGKPKVGLVSVMNILETVQTMVQFQKTKTTVSWKTVPKPYQNENLHFSVNSDLAFNSLFTSW